LLCVRCELCDVVVLGGRDGGAAGGLERERVPWMQVVHGQPVDWPHGVATTAMAARISDQLHEGLRTSVRYKSMNLVVPSGSWRAFRLLH